MRLTAPIVVDTKDGHRALDPRSLNSVWELKVMGAKNIMGSLAAIDTFAAMEALRPYGIAWLMGQNPMASRSDFWFHRGLLLVLDNYFDYRCYCSGGREKGSQTQSTIYHPISYQCTRVGGGGVIFWGERVT